MNEDDLFDSYEDAVEDGPVGREYEDDIGEARVRWAPSTSRACRLTS